MNIIFTTIPEVDSNLEAELTTQPNPSAEITVTAQHALSELAQPPVTVQRQYSIPQCSELGRIGLAFIGIFTFGLAALGGTQGNQTLTIGASIVAGVAFIILCGIMTVPACNQESESPATTYVPTSPATAESDSNIEL